MTKQQALWAKQHDWFRNWCHLGYQAEDTEYAVVVRDDELPQQSRIFTDYQELRIWAGY